MANNKIIFGNTTLVDLTSDTAIPEKVVNGVSFMGKNGVIQTGTMTPSGASVSGTNLSIAGKTYQIPDWSTSSIEDIATILDSHYAGKINICDWWKIGTERTVTVNAIASAYGLETQIQQDIVMVLSNKGGKYLSDGVTECAFQVDQKAMFVSSGKINTSNTSVGGWKECARRKWCNDTLKNALPQDFASLFKEHINQSGKGNGSTSGVYDTLDYFALRAEVEIFGSVTNSVVGEGSKVEYTSGGTQFLRSPSKSTTYTWVMKYGSSSDTTYPDYPEPFKIFGVI